ncbi:hypothetical protein C3E77_01940 [Mycetocola zhujimingii]|nr:hypothetical protein C3E77_01940 [Mycetocola zhujimingii]
MVDPARLFRNCLARFRARRALGRISDSLLDEIGPLALEESESDGDPDLCSVAMDLSWLESQMAGGVFWSLSARGRGFRVHALEQIHDLLPRVRALPLPRTAAVLEQIACTLPAIDRRR